MIQTAITKDTITRFITKQEDNIILIDKPADWSSFDVVKRIKVIGKFNKVGHAGTLDPFATGLLILGTNRRTKELSDISSAEKGYVATVTFGEDRDTYDITGAPVKSYDVTDFDPSLVRESIAFFIGESEQLAPMYSAKKVNGTRLYKLARNGFEVEREPHSIMIFEIKELEQKGTDFKFYLKCSKGTYVRTVFHDIGQKCGYGAYLKSLRRVSVNDFTVDQALTINEFQKYWSALN